MAAASGRKLRIKYDADGEGAGTAVVIAGARTDGLTISNEYIDITDKDDSGVRTFLDDIGTQSISLSCEGVLKDDTLQGLARSAGEGTALHYFEIEVASIGTYRGQFAITSFELGGASGSEAMTFTASFESSGPITFT